MNKTQIIGVGLVAAVLLAVGGAAVFSIADQPEPKTQLVRPGVEATRPAPVAPVQPAPVPPATLAPAAVVAPVAQAGQAFRPFKCVNQRTRATVFELGRARNAQFMGQRNNRSFWKVDTPSRTVTFNTDVRDVNCAFTG